MRNRTPYPRGNYQKDRKNTRSNLRSARDVRRVGGAKVRKNRKTPIPLRVLAVFIIPLVVIHLINGVFLSSFYSVLSLLFLAIYCLAGYLGGKYRFEDHIKNVRGAPAGAMKEGAACGLTLGVVNVILLILIVVIFGFVSSGITALFGGISAIICAPGEIFSSLILGGFGGWISERTH